MRKYFFILFIILVANAEGQVMQPVLMGSVDWNQVSTMTPPEKLPVIVRHRKMVKTIFQESTPSIVSRKIDPGTQIIKWGAMIPTEGSFTFSGNKIAEVFKENAPPLLSRDNQEFNIHYADKPHGFITNNTSDFAEDKQHNIWMATDIGLIKYNGYHYYIYNEKSDLPFKNVWSLAMDKRERLWIATDKGVFFLRHDSLFTILCREINFSEAFCNKIQIDRNENVWLCSKSKGAIRINGNQISIYDTRCGLPSNGIHNVLIDKDNNILCAFSIAGLAIIKKDKTIWLLHNSPKMQYPIIMSLLEDENGLWIGGFKCGLINLNKKDTIQYSPEGNYTERIFDIKKAPGGLWLSLYGKGLCYFNMQTKFMITEKNGMQSRFPYFLYEDSYHNIWVSDLYNGFSRLNENTMYIQPFQNKLIYAVFNIASDAIKGKWIFTDGAGTFYQKGKTITKYSYTLPGGAAAFRQSNYGIVASDGTVWMGTYGEGLVQGGKDYFSIYRWSNDPDKSIIMSACEGEKKAIWFSTKSNGLMKYDRTSFWQYNQKNGLLGNNVSRLFSDSSKRIYCGFQNGLQRFSDRKIETLTIDKKPFNKQVLNFLYVDSSSSFIGTENNGLILIHQNKAYRLSTNEGLISNKILNIIRSKDRKIWITTNKSVEYFIFKGANVQEHTIFSQANGSYIIASNENILIDSLGMPYWPLLWPMADKYLVYNPIFSNSNKPPPHFYIENVFIDGKASSNHLSQSILPNQKILIDYSVKYWGRENNLLLQYLLISNRGDTSIQSIDNKGHILISEISPGKYKLYIKGNDNSKVYISESILLEVRDFWYNTWLFRFIISLIVFSGIILYFITKNKRQLVINELLKTKVNEQTAQLRNEKAQLETSYHIINQNSKEKDLLLQEINHRVKNNLQFMIAILDMQLQSDLPEEAFSAIQSTSKRMNAIALVHEMLYDNKNLGELSAKKYVHELTKHYQEMGTRPFFPIKFNIDAEDISLTLKSSISLGMIISELISNSFKHAFQNITNPEISIRLSYSKETDEVQLKVNDNGNGLLPGITPKNGLGNRLIDIFSRELEGKYSIDYKNHYTFILKFSFSKIYEKNESY